MSTADLVALHLHCLQGEESALRIFPQAEAEKVRDANYQKAWRLCVDLTGFLVEAGVVEQ